MLLATYVHMLQKKLVLAFPIVTTVIRGQVEINWNQIVLQVYDWF